MKKLLIFIALLHFTVSSYAWNAVGHSTGGAIAYYHLKKNSPVALAKVVDILKHHPWYTTPRWSDKLAGVSADQRDVTLFMLASTYPDDARSNPELGGGEKTKWHYVDYPFVPAGSSAHGNAPGNPNAQMKITELLASVKGEHDMAQQAIDICWIFHLIEDVHQPLHAVSLYDDNHPNGDKGGNDSYITFTSSTSPVKMHSYWDALIKGAESNAPANAESLLANPLYKESVLTELRSHTTVQDWIQKESFVLAKEKVYDNGRINGTKEQPTPVDDAYGISSRQIAERRIVLSGIRLSKEFARIFG